MAKKQRQVTHPHRREKPQQYSLARQELLILPGYFVPKKKFEGHHG